MLDIWGLIIKIIECDKDRCYLAMTCTDLSKIKICFNDPIEVEKIVNSRWFDNFTNIRVATELPDCSHNPQYRIKAKINKLPESITHLILGCQFKDCIKNSIPETVKTITFCWDGNLGFFHPTLLKTFIDIALLWSLCLSDSDNSHFFCHKALRRYRLAL